MTNTQDQIVRKTVSLPESLWKELGDYRFLRRFPTETAAVVDVLSRGLKAGAVFGAIVDIVAGQRSGYGKFSEAATRTFGEYKPADELVADDVREWSLARGLTLTEVECRATTTVAA